MDNYNSLNSNVKKLTKNDIGKKICNVSPPYTVYGLLDCTFTGEIYTLKEIIKSSNFGGREVFLLVDSKGNETETYPQHTVEWIVLPIKLDEL